MVLIFRTEVQGHVQDCALVVHFDRCDGERENDPALCTLYRVAHEVGRKGGGDRRPVQMSIIPVDAISHVAAFAPAFEHRDNQNTTSQSCSSDGAYLFDVTRKDEVEDESEEEENSEEEEDTEEPPEQFGSDPELDQLQAEIMSRLRSGSHKPQQTIDAGAASGHMSYAGASAAPKPVAEVGSKRPVVETDTGNLDTVVYRHFEMVDAPH